MDMGFMLIYEGAECRGCRWPTDMAKILRNPMPEKAKALLRDV